MRIPKLLQNSVAYSIVTVLQKGLSFLLLPIYTLYMSPADYGIMGVSFSVASFLSIFMTLSLGAASARFYYKRKDDADYIKRLYGTIVTIVLINSVVFGSIFICLHKWLIDPFLGNIDFFPFVLLAVLSTIVSPLYLYFQEYLQTLQKGVYYSINAMINFLIQVCLSVIFLVVFKWGVVGILAANLITAVIFFIYAFVVFSRSFKWGIDNDIAKESFKYSLPLVPHQLAAWSNGTIDKLLVNGLKTEADAGLYNLGQQYSSMMGIITSSVNRAYVPWFYDMARQGEEGRKIITKVANMLVCLIAWVAVALSLYGKELLNLMVQNPEYDGVWTLIPFLVIGYLFQGLYLFFVNVLFLNHTKNVFLITITSMSVNVLLNILFIPQWGCMGSALAFSTTFLFQSLLALGISMKKEKEFRYNWIQMYFICFIGCFFSLSSILFDTLPLLLCISGKTFIILTLALLIVLRYKGVIGLLKDMLHK